MWYQFLANRPPVSDGLSTSEIRAGILLSRCVLLPKPYDFLSRPNSRFPSRPCLDIDTRRLHPKVVQWHIDGSMYIAIECDIPQNHVVV